MSDEQDRVQRTDRHPAQQLMQDRLELRRLFQTYHLLDLVGDESESIEWFREVMMEIAGWVGDRERGRRILERFTEEWDRRREEQRDGQPVTDLPDVNKKEKPNPHAMARFRRIRIVASD
jgi:hypothetical protein